MNIEDTHSLTLREAEALKTIHDLQNAGEALPSARQLGEALGVSTSRGTQLLRALKQKGALSNLTVAETALAEDNGREGDDVVMTLLRAQYRNNPELVGWVDGEWVVVERRGDRGWIGARHPVEPQGVHLATHRCARAVTQRMEVPKP